MYDNPSGLIVAVSKAAGRRLRNDRSNDRSKDCFLMQKGCYILNHWGFGPIYSFKHYVDGPFSSELAEDCEEIHDFGTDTTVPEEAIRNLSDILSKGVRFTEAYATLLLAKHVNPGVSNEIVVGKVLEVEPRLKKEVYEAAPLVLP